MRDYYPTATLARISQRGPVSARVLLWIEANEFATGDPVTLGLWTGTDHRDFVIRGQSRLYIGRGSLIRGDAIRYAKGLAVRNQRIWLAGLTDEVREAMLEYDVRGGAVEIHEAIFEHGTNQLVAEPHRLWAGFVGKVNETTPAKGGQAELMLTLASAARSLTRGLSRYRSPATLHARAPDDDLRKYVPVTRKIDVPWGVKDKRTKAEDAAASKAMASWTRTRSDK